jgi:hypothetical protein
MISTSTRRDICGLEFWIYVSAWCSVTGWTLSVFGLLDRAGYATALLIFILGLIWLCRTNGCHLQPLRLRRFNPFLPGRLASRVWLLLTCLAFLGGAAYRPANYDYLTYRFPRVLHWCADHYWQWINTMDVRMNLSATGTEWLMTPLYVCFQTDRLFFLINFIPYLFLPGLIFSVFRHLGISPRISWWWMWTLPCGYCYILQAASVGNDTLAAIYLLASLHYLFLAKDTGSARSLVLSCLAIALLTGAKATNLPLVLPWLAALFFNRAFVIKKARPVGFISTLLVAAIVSFLPVALINIHFTGSYSGDPANKVKVQLTNPVAGVLGNSLQIAKDNMVPPLLPKSIDWAPLVPSYLRVYLHRDFPRLDLRTGELQIEEGAGVGLGIVLFASLFIIEAIRARTANPGRVIDRKKQALWVVGAGAVALLAYMSKMGSEAASRLITAYYPLLLAGVLVLTSLDGRVMRRRIFKWGGLIAMLSALPLVILCPERPLFPVQIVSDFMIEFHVSPVSLARYNQVYSVYAARADVFKDLHVFIPPGKQVIGYLAGDDDSETSLWRPFGTRKVIDVTPVDSPVEMKAQGIRYVVISDNALSEEYHQTITSLATTWSATLVAKKSVVLKAHVGPETWYLLSL